MITVIPDISLVYQMINFLILLFVLNVLLYKPIRKVLLERKAKIQGLESGVEKATADLVSQEESYKNGLRQARSEGLKEKEAFVEEASKQEREIIDQINQKAQANLARIKKQVADETEQARKTLEKEVEVFAKAIGEKILGRAL
ncbi:ATP synthase F0 subunit B [Desulfotignum phosphitoxidans]|uniref:ATP synthase subunit b n=1 Tax=Desulfotignum phosphitoxidans DSM 13687 TaxID=1286635 RepID=S0G7D1_9BACT|nr:ATP synthase F0 subunit B [Desulfotignum phosphitoxidans]EMS80776.1 F-type H+-transporting ATPase subunit b, AtpF [Desulfotignum phosphitoxidans DSM 13687]MCF8075755.1 ATP synthase F0 subunit B [Desulfotignum sp.]MCF8090061.1 ATP synthase F0 subunit B [Desulfotignum sp.]MCF8138921.1 ATP synthase F0 subunit B [Desulfotignum sp.]